MLQIYLGAFAAFVIGLLLCHKTSVHEPLGGSEFERARARRFIGFIFIAIAVLGLGLALLPELIYGRPAIVTAIPSFTQISLRANSAVSSSANTNVLPAEIKSDSRNSPLKERGQQDLRTSVTAPAISNVVSANTGSRDVQSSTWGNPTDWPAKSASFMASKPDQPSDKRQLNDALSAATAAVDAEPQNPAPYRRRATMEFQMKQWDQAQADYNRVLNLDKDDSLAKFNLAEIKFAQKLYDEARPGFCSLTQDRLVGDLARYKAFLCDLYGNHKDLAADELKAFSLAGSQASYYFANVAWSLYYNKTTDAREWLHSAERIYSPAKSSLYEYSLIQLGYLPIKEVP